MVFPLRIQAELPEFGNNQEETEVDAASEKVTGSDTVRSTADEGNPENCDALSEVSDLEWDTDLETEGTSPGDAALLLSLSSEAARTD